VRAGSDVGAVWERGVGLYLLGLLGGRRDPGCGWCLGGLRRVVYDMCGAGSMLGHMF
jgi:hypothetical protein